MAETTPAQTTPVAAPAVNVERNERFVSVYANNVQLQTTAWDVSLVFGQFDQQAGQSKVRQTVEVTMAWAETKAVCYLILQNMAFYEAINGTIPTPVAMKPTPPALDLSNPILKAAQERLEKLQAFFFGEK